MVEHIPLSLPDNPRLVHNITHFARALRKAGLPAGPGTVINAIRAIEAAGFATKEDFFWVLHACFVNRREHHAVFSQVFRMYWRDPQYLERMMAILLPALRGVQDDRVPDAGEKRAAEALVDGGNKDAHHYPTHEDELTSLEVDASMTMSSEERLRSLDFEQMSAEEVAQAKRLIARLRLPVAPLASRRREAASNGSHINWRKTIRDSMRKGGELQNFARQRPRIRWPNLIALCDISGSMSHYSRIILHFLHVISNMQGAGWSRVHAFTFGTRLTNITNQLKSCDVDAALKSVGSLAQDWEGGTRIGSCLHVFNRDWSRRVLGQGAVVLLMSDGLDREDPNLLEREMERLHLSARRLIWVNPLLRWEGFAPKAQGILAMLPHVDSFRAGHSIASLEDLADTISRFDDAGEKRRLLSQIYGGD
ncbi:MAG: VWA domain-containing protein [Aestuariivita sp.]|nr:VWA domain-containing protein [Aestuariivita sp.]